MTNIDAARKTGKELASVLQRIAQKSPNFIKPAMVNYQGYINGIVKISELATEIHAREHQRKDKTHCR